MKSGFWAPTAVLLLAGAAIFLPALGQERSISEAETRHAEIARGMVQSGDYVVPRLGGLPYIDKAPFFNWSVAALFRLTGRVDFTLARLPSAICSIALMIGLYFLGWRWFSPRAGVYAAMIWATSWLVVEWGRLCQMDVMMTCFLFCSIYLADVAAAQKRPIRMGAAWMATCALIAVSTLCKTPVMLSYAAAMGIHVPDAGTQQRPNGG